MQNVHQTADWVWHIAKAPEEYRHTPMCLYILKIYGEVSWDVSIPVLIPLHILSEMPAVIVVKVNIAFCVFCVILHLTRSRYILKTCIS